MKINPIVSLIQTRMSSTRLPGKALLPLGGATVLDQVVRRAETWSKQVVVCTSVDETDDPIESHCRETGMLCVRGSLGDVFDRFRATLAHPRVENTEWFARITGDCPLISMELAQQLLDSRAENLDYVCVPQTDLPRGISIEVVRRSTFESIDHSTLDTAEKEHVTLHLYEKKGRYSCLWLDPPEAVKHPELRLTLDFAEDYTLIKALFDWDPDLSAETAIAHLSSNPELVAINADCVQKGAR
jgi:spore coat polysaccharide biosynthesis protein SpsF